MDMNGLLTINDVKLQWKAKFDEKYHCTDEIEIFTRNDPDTELTELLSVEDYRSIVAEISDTCYENYIELTSPKPTLRERQIEIAIDIAQDERDES